MEEKTDDGDLFFLERGDGFVFACSEREAWNTLRSSSNWQRRDFKIVGVSDGKTYQEKINRSRSKKIEIEKQLKVLQEKLDRYISTEDSLLYDDLLEETDPKVKRVRELREVAKKELEGVQTQLQNFSQKLVTGAFNEELEKAKLTPRQPRNFDIEIGSSSSSKREEILAMMGKRVRK